MGISFFQQPAQSNAAGSRYSSVTCQRVGPQSDPGAQLLTGSGEAIFDAAAGETLLTVGSQSHAPGRVYCSGRQLLNAGNAQYMHGSNTPWHNWNEFGATSGNVYDGTWWNDEFLRLVDRGANSMRVWVNCDSTNLGIVLDSSGTASAPTAQFWSDLDDFMELAETHEVFVMPTIMSFDHFLWGTAGSERWHQMLGSEVKVQAFIDNVIVPICERYADNPWFWAIDLGNEIDWLTERMDLATPRSGTATPVGGGSLVVNFGQRLSDYVVGQQLYVNSVNMGAVVTRVSDTQCICTNAYSGASATFSAGNWGFSGCNWSTIQRYLAMASASIHELPLKPLVSMGCGTVKYCSTSYDGDYYSDTILAGITGNSRSYLDFHQIHWYNWAEPWYHLTYSPVAHGLTAKPAIMGELPGTWPGMNLPYVFAWKPQTYYASETTAGANRGMYVWKDDGGNKRIYRCVTSGTTGPVNGTAGADTGPSGTGTGIADGTAAWDYCTNNCTWRQSTEYSATNYDMVTSYDNSDGNGHGLWLCTTSGTSASGSGGPYGTGPTFEDGTVVWTYVRKAVTDEGDLFDILRDGGWYGQLGWTSNTVDLNNGWYSVDLQQIILKNWAGTTDYYQNAMVINDTGKVYRCLAQGKSAASGGPNGTDASISDGDNGLTWAYAYAITPPGWTSAGLAIKDWSDANEDLVYPDTSGTWSASGVAARQSLSRTWTAAGVSDEARMLVTLAASEANLIQRVGMFDANDGYFLEVSGATPTVSLVVRSSGTDTKIDRANWDSDVSLTLTLPQQIVVARDGFVGGLVRFGFLVGANVQWVHSVGNANEAKLASANVRLPLRWEIEATGDISGPLTLSAGAGAVVADSSQVTGCVVASNRQAASINVGGSSQVRELISLRVNSNFARHSTMRAKHITVINTSGEEYRFNWRLVLNADISGAGAWTTVAQSIADVNITRPITQNTGKLLATGFARGSVDRSLESMPMLNVGIDGVSDVLSLQIQNLESAEHYFYVSIEWEEIC